MSETAAAGWYICYRADGTPRRWHYFPVDDVRSLCGNASGFERTIGQVERAETVNWFARERCGDSCARCMAVRRPIEDAV